MIFELDGFPRHTYDNESLKPNATFTRVWISGMHKHYISISAHENSEMFVIQFKAYGAYPFLHHPIEKLNDLVVPAEEILNFNMRAGPVIKKVGFQYKGWSCSREVLNFDTRAAPVVRNIKYQYEGWSCGKRILSFNKRADPVAKKYSISILGLVLE